MAWLNVDAEGEIDRQHLQQLLIPGPTRPALVTVMSANNETGVIQPITEVAAICAEAGVPLHVDATQTIGKLPFSPEASGAAAVSFSAHKFHGPVGIGALWLAAGVKLQPMLFGGEQQLESRPGTEPVALIVGMARALRLAMEELEPSTATMRRLRDRLESRLLGEFPELVSRAAARNDYPPRPAFPFWEPIVRRCSWRSTSRESPAAAVRLAVAAAAPPATS